jgi:hypothetical protein
MPRNCEKSRSVFMRNVSNGSGGSSVCGLKMGMLVSFDNLLMSLLGAPLSVCRETGTNMTGGADRGLSEELSASVYGRRT